MDNQDAIQTMNPAPDRAGSGIRFDVDAARRIAFDSPDHLVPHGTKRDNSRNPLFNRRLSLLYPGRRLRILDVGCSGGGFVKSCLDDGNIAMGLEGSDYSQKHRRAEWATIPESLFTCDVTSDFNIRTTADIQSAATFDVITAWEVMEHIRARDLPKLCDNIKRHLARAGMWIMSVAPIDDVINGVQLHQTVQSREWWIRFFADQRLQNHPRLVSYFGDDWVRGRFQHAPSSFHLVLMRTGEEAPALPPAALRLQLGARSAVRYAPVRFRLWKAAARSCAGRILKPVLKPLRTAR